ncbi:MAG: DUF4332 domain-containing protein [Thermoanaerobaculia bacterium]|nr:DUF4332 domain-containing protein [Thermoanaerobaculia bacterium]
MKSSLPWWAGAGVGIFAAGVVALVLDLPRWNAVWYVPAWWGYLLVLDAVVHRLEGRSWVGERRRELGLMLFWSAPFWFLFEAYNLRLENWYYVFVLRDPLLGEIVAWLCFATVLPACFFHYELVRSLGWFESVRWRPLAVGPKTKTVCAVLGVASILGPLVWPRFTFPLVWGATLWLPELWNYRAREPSFLGDLERGDPRRLLRFLVGGLFAGIAWESLNFWARSKWIYTVPGFEDWKLFEMPVAGFLGFPVLAVAAFSFWTLLRRIVRGGGWKVWLLAALAVVGSHFAFEGLRRHTVRSERPLLSEIEVLSESDVDRLRAAGAPTPELLVRRVERRGLETVAEASGIEPDELERAYGVSRLALHKGMGVPAAEGLWELGIRSIAELADADAEASRRRLAEMSAVEDRSPRLAEVRVWIRAARAGEGPRR